MLNIQTVQIKICPVKDKVGLLGSARVGFGLLYAKITLIEHNVDIIVVAGDYRMFNIQDVS
jgi:hypothetical protein